MKSKFLLAIILFTGSCHNLIQEGQQAQLHEASTSPPNYTKTQKWMYTLKNQFIQEFKKAQSADLKKEIREKYKEKLQEYLMDSCLKVINCGNVLVRNIKREISAESEIITGVFVDKSSVYTFSAAIAAGEDRDNYPEYKFLNGLQQGMNISIKFLYTGDCNVTEPSDVSGQVFIIKATPYVE